MARHDTDLAFVGRDHARTVGADQTRLRTLKRALDRHHVEHRDALGNAHHQRDPGIDRFEDGVGRKRRRHVDHGSLRAGAPDSLGHRVEHRQVEVRGVTLAGRHAAHHAGAVGDRLFGMEGALRAGEALTDDLGIGVNENGHYFASFTAATALRAASDKSSAEMIGRPERARMSLPSSTLVPSRRTTKARSG